MIKRILVIDDDEAIRKVFLLALEETEYQVDTAPSGEKGVELAGEQKYDLIYLDLKMPGMNGVETLRKLRALNQDVPIYIITAFWEGFSEELNQAHEDGIAFELMKKPLTMEQLLNLTKGILEGFATY